MVISIPKLSRRRDLKAREESWLIFYGDVHVGMIARRVGVPVGVDRWGWILGFYPRTEPHQYSDGTAATFDQARSSFETAWQALLPTLTEADFDRWRHARDWTERKYSKWKRGELLPSQKPNSMMRCPCGATFDRYDPAGSYVHRNHIYAEQEIR
jgi:hypothetical protein